MADTSNLRSVFMCSTRPDPPSLAVPPKSAHVAARYSPPALGNETVDAGEVESSTYV